MDSLKKSLLKQLQTLISSLCVYLFFIFFLSSCNLCLRATMSKQRGIVDEVLIPLLRQLDTAERLLSKSANTNLLHKIKQDLQALTYHYEVADSKETEVVGKFEPVCRLIDDLLQSARPKKPPPSSSSSAEQENTEEAPNGVPPRPIDQPEIPATEEAPSLPPSATGKGKETEDFSVAPVQVPSFSSKPSTFQIGETSSASASRPSASTSTPLTSQLDSKLADIDKEISKIHESLQPVLQKRPEDKGSSTPVEDQARAENGEEFQQWQKMYKESAALSLLSSRIENLDNQLKGCLFTFTAFPENEVIKKRLLIHWWIGEGLITPYNRRTAEENGEMNVRELVSKCLVEPVDSKWDLDVVVGCKMYSWIYRTLMLSPNRNDYLSPSLRARLVQTGEELKSATENYNQEELLLTVYNISNSDLRIDEDWFVKKKNLGVAQLGRWQNSPRYHIEVDNTDFLRGLEQCTKLKYLSLRGISRITELPDSIGKLTNLIILDLRACHNLEKLTVAITSLKNLTHLDASECYLLEQMPKGLGTLSKLQVLKGFVIGNARSQRRRSTDPCSLTELANLKYLRKLSISIGRYSVLSDEESKTLGNLSVVKSLMIRWGLIVRSSKGSSTKAQERTLLRKDSLVEASVSLPLPPNLEKLDLRCFPKSSLSSMSPDILGKLKKLYISGGELSRLDGPRDWKVEVLRLKSLKNLNLEWPNLQNAFPNLACLEVRCCGGRSFAVEDGGVWASFPSKEGGCVWTKMNTRWTELQEEELQV